jgi:SRSO17 transposase
MAQRLGEVHYQALHHFVAVSLRDWRPVRRRLAEVMTAALSPTAWVVDDTGFFKDVRPTITPHESRGRRPRPRYRDKPCSLHQLALQAGQQACVELIWRRGSKGLQRGRFLALRVRPAGVTPRRLARQAGTELPMRWLLAEWPAGKPAPVKYWLSNLPEATPLVELVRLARLRWRVEQDYRELKGALGLDHFEGRGWPGWHHHMTLVSVAHGFLTLERLRFPNLVASA